MAKESIFFNSSFNINLSYPKASLLFRILAFGIDFIIVVILMIIFYFLLGDNFITSVIGIVLFSFWNLFFEILFNGQSIGKLALGLRIITLQGENPSIKALILRWAFKVLDILICLGIGAILAILSTRLNQRLGDIVAGTTVVETKTAKVEDLNYLEKLNTQNYTITYPEVKQYTEDEALLMKDIYLRHLQNKSPNNEDLLQSMTKRISKDLGIEYKNIKDKSVFLKQVIEDYIILTR